MNGPSRCSHCSRYNPDNDTWFTMFGMLLCWTCFRLLNWNQQRYWFTKEHP